MVTKGNSKKVNNTPFNYIEGAENINKAIKSHALKGAKLEKERHIIAVSCLVHCDKHGDITVAQRFVESLPNSTRKNALKDWFLAFGKFNYDMETKQLTFARDKTSDIEQAIVTPFWDFAPEKEYQPYDVMKALQMVIKRAHKAQENGQEGLPSEVINLVDIIVKSEGKVHIVPETQGEEAQAA